MAATFGTGPRLSHAQRAERNVRLISAHVIRQVEELLKTSGLSRRGIARQVGIGRNVVNQVAAGKVTSAERFAREAKRQTPTIVGEFRCSTCGGLSTRFPCAKCYIETIRPSLEPLQAPPEHGLVLGLELRPEHRVGYEQVRRWRREVARKHA
jgi:predicted XRE-type DNA-binding protein